MELPFKKGDRVRFVEGRTVFSLEQMSNTGVDVSRSYTVVNCYQIGSIGEFLVKIDGDYTHRSFSYFWFELDKTSIVKAIIADL